ncbi:MAG: oligoribonuclease [Candidatus Binatus sp.]|jgi:oligoribonuclease NrnB/cAMP/cGMP phosphodiesterase (DHH superfamily)|nr:oligoribonuclease [Candidatus Binatus sp.]
MTGKTSNTIHVISHGPSCLDGVMAAAAVARFYEGHRVNTILAGNSDADRTIQAISIKPENREDEVWITDLSWSSPETGARLTELSESGVRVYWIDHHRTAVSRADAPEFKVPFTGKVLDETYSAARLTYNFLKERSHEMSEERRRDFESFEPFVMIADDHDRWVHRIPESQDWALAVQTLGGLNSYREILRLRGEPRMSRKLRTAFESGQDAMRRSLELANATMVDRKLENGIMIRTACCFGYSSEVASRLYDGQHRTVVALFDLRSQGVSLRRSADCDIDLSLLAEIYGGGGHAAASGFLIPELRRLPAERLAEILGDQIEKSKT